MVITYYRLAGITFCTEASTDHLFDSEKDFERFRVNATEADVVLRIHKISPPSSGCSDTNQGMGHLMCSRLVMDHLKACLAQPGQAQVEFDREEVTVRNFARCEYDYFYLDDAGKNGGEKPRVTRESQIAANLRQVYATFLPNFNGIMIHAAGLVRGDKAAVFVAPSGGGKSTTIGLSQVGMILNDDHIIIRQQQEAVFVHATPFGRITCGPGSARLGGIFLLEKAKSFKISPVTPKEIVECVWDSITPYIYFLPRELRVRVFTMFYDACSHTPIYRMGFSKDYVDWEAIDAAMRV